MCDYDQDDYGGEVCTLYINKWVRAARKEHLCRSCGVTVKAGERYMRHFNLYDGEVTTEKVCFVCGDAIEEFGRLHSFVPGTPGDTPRILEECIENGDEVSRAKWAPILSTIEARRLRR